MSASATEREYIFVDGGCLRSAVRKICEDVFGDEQAYRPFLPGIVNSYDKLFYYDAIPGKSHGEGQEAYERRVEPEHQRFATYQALDRVHVALGKIVGKDRRQKGVDVRLAVDMMTHAFRGKVERVTLFAGDSDFVPLLKALVAEGMHVTLWHPPQAATDLRGAADVSRQFSFNTNCDCFTKNDSSPTFKILMDAPHQVVSLGHDIDAMLRNYGREYSGEWDEETLTVARLKSSGALVEYINFKAAGATIGEAIAAFEAIYGWELRNIGEDWIRRI